MELYPPDLPEKRMDDGEKYPINLYRNNNPTGEPVLSEMYDYEGINDKALAFPRTEGKYGINPLLMNRSYTDMLHSHWGLPYIINNRLVFI